MFRKMLPFVGILILAIALAACSVGTAQGATPTEPQAAANGVPMGNGNGRGGPGRGGMNAGGAMPGGMQVAAEGTLTEAETADLLHMREEEKLARDVYLTLYDKWQVPVFQNIARAEQMHMNALGNLIDGFGLDDPVAQTQDQRGVFVNADLQNLYNQLVSQGESSLVDALTVGATIEDLDIQDLNEALARTENASVATVYQNLKRGSEAHMRAFVSNLRAQGADYSPQYITAEEFQQILAGTMGHGQGGAGGHGCGMAEGADGAHGHGRWAQPTATAQP